MKKLDLPEDVLPLGDAEDYAENWRGIASSNLGEGYIKAFNIPPNDFQKILESGATGIRAYMGYTSSQLGNGEAKLLLVGTDEEGSDMIDYENGLYVYDFTTPCPNMCSPSPTPLNPVSNRKNKK